MISGALEAVLEPSAAGLAHHCQDGFLVDRKERPNRHLRQRHIGGRPGDGGGAEKDHRPRISFQLERHRDTAPGVGAEPAGTELTGKGKTASSS